MYFSYIVLSLILLEGASVSEVIISAGIRPPALRESIRKGRSITV